jgi:predicted RNase H-like nuclease (RuvC/YqgF family)
MDVKLQNAYVEVLLDNFMAVVKQNIMFQAQMEIMKSAVSEADDVKRKIVELSDRNVSLQQTNEELVKKLESLTGENVNLKTTVGQKDIQVNNTTNIIREKDRLQSAVNGYMRQVKDLENEIKDVKSQSQEVLISNNKRIEELTKYIDKLEMVVPANKLKKVKSIELTEVESKEVVVQEDVEDDIKSGGTF